jgi:hypothetical protein
LPTFRGQYPTVRTVLRLTAKPSTNCRKSLEQKCRHIRKITNRATEICQRLQKSKSQQDSQLGVKIVVWIHAETNTRNTTKQARLHIFGGDTYLGQVESKQPIYGQARKINEIRLIVLVRWVKCFAQVQFYSDGNTWNTFWSKVTFYSKKSELSISNRLDDNQNIEPN